MIFVRSKDGVSHNPEEWSSKEDCAAGANVLYHTVLRLAMGE
jgi:allantoate deiminase